MWHPPSHHTRQRQSCPLHRPPRLPNALLSLGIIRVMSLPPVRRCAPIGFAPLGGVHPRGVKTRGTIVPTEIFCFRRTLEMLPPSAALPFRLALGWVQRCLASDTAMTKRPAYRCRCLTRGGCGTRASPPVTKVFGLTSYPGKPAEPEPRTSVCGSWVSTSASRLGHTGPGTYNTHCSPLA